MASVAALTDAYLSQWAAVRSWCDTVSRADGQLPSILHGWSVDDLIAHLGLVAASIPAAAAGSHSTARPQTLTEYVRTYAAGAEAIAHRTRDHAPDRSAILAELDVQAAAAEQALGEPALSAKTVVAARRGPIRWSDFISTRCIELVVHSDDLARSLPQHAAPEITVGAARVATRTLATILAERAPGHSVEVRVPPYAAVQVVEGPRHTRGTPSAVVELPPMIFVRLATGRLAWDEALTGGQVRASGERTDLRRFLPLLA